DGSPIAGQGTLFPEYNEGNGKRQKPKALAVILDCVKDEDGDGAANVTDVELFLKRNNAARKALRGCDKYPGGDFRSPECIALLKEADIVVTNPPFSLFREYVAQLVENEKRFLIIGNVQAITYKEIFPLIKGDRLWMGVTIHSGDREFRVPDHYPLNAAGWRIDENGVKYIRVKGVRWYTNLDHGRRHEELKLMSISDNLRYNKKLKGKAYDQYDNYDAIDVSFTDAIPGDYDGVMGVPITFLDKYNPDQFEILGITKTWHGGAYKTYPMQTQVSKDGSESLVSKLNDGPAIKVSERPTGRTYYRVGTENFIQLYARLLIRRRAKPANGTTR
ncbi:MAG: adenine-specific methyltransferase EcoRI family protein, partial [Dehalococcoidia bacterium]|nr:adenine-specific methyltransferase EcoRI family protein [Dehalococcoidia bacterium]